MNKKIVSLIALFSAAVISSTYFGSTFADWVVTDNAGNKTIRISPGAGNLKTITYYLPSGNNGQFTSHTLDVMSGENLYDSLSSYTTAVGDYSFVEWHNGTEHFASYDTGYSMSKIANTTTVTDDITVYAKYVQPNVLYYWDGQNRYVTSTTSSQAIGASSLFYGRRIYSYDGVEGTEVQLGTSSGKYSLTKNANDWTIKRIVKVGVNDVSSWWFNDSAKTFVQLYSSSDSSETWTNQLSFTSNKATLEVDLKYNRFIITRAGSSGWSNVYNQTVDIWLDWKGVGADNQIYSSTYDTVYVQAGTSDGKHNYTWYS